MRLLFAGTPAVAVPALEALIGSRHEVVAVLTRADARAGRGRQLVPSPVRQRAEEAGIEVITDRPRSEGFVERLEALQVDGRLQNLELARQVGLSPSACLRRVRLLEEGGYIDRYVALLNETKVGRGFTVFVRVWLRGQDEDTTNHFINSVKSLPEVLECHLMAGDCDFLLRVAVADLDAYRQFQIRHLNRIAGVQNTKTEIPMQRIKQTTRLPL